MSSENQTQEEREFGHDLCSKHEDRTINSLRKVIRIAVRLLAIIMVLVILWGIGDVIYVLYIRLTSPPLLLLSIHDILATFGAFLAVLIAIEIFVNISMYLSTNVIQVRLVVATALMAISRKVIIFDFDTLSPHYIYASGVVIVALGITYWLLSKKM